VVPFWSPWIVATRLPVNCLPRRDARPVGKGTKRGPERCSPESQSVTAGAPCLAAVVPMQSDERLC
jgi:hypothetical protein